ncbi:neurogenic locus notch homolog protein 1-like [Xenia sp. Carnegie-2017]|uniref:neurogenic locus notch homolog protein 1-like n=1 Tax=Xenia sp. Carnegie-2017 TaxID=2897299 RepID=UPI001F045A40|nr:neurogenic locus notch homolog protein 1-like [Xenia sp. Carnegie-2017]
MTANKHHIFSVSLQSIAQDLTLDMAKEKIYWRVSNGNVFSCDYYSHNVIDFGTSGDPMAVFGDFIYIMISVGQSVVSVHNTTDERTRRKFFLPVNNDYLDLAVAIHSITPDSNATNTFRFPLCGPYTYYRKTNGTLNCTCMEGFSGECNSCQVNVKPVCVKANWWRSFNKQGWSTCDTTNQFITGLYRSTLSANYDGLYRLEEVKCCKSSPLYIGQKSICRGANWWVSFNKKGWSVCSNGYFLNALYRTNGQHLHNLQGGKCCKPVNHPDKYGDCYHENIKNDFKKKGWTMCKKDGYYVTGLRRDSGDWLKDIDSFKCCKMWSVGVCDHSPCKNGGSCVADGSSYNCTCPPDFIGIRCETKVPNPCEPNPCKNGGQCNILGNSYTCKCKPAFGGNNCEHSQSTCIASGDPHYTSFDGKRFDFMGDCEYDFAKDCSKNKLFTVRTKNTRCGGLVTCTAAVKIYIAGYFIQFTRQSRSAVVNGVRLSQFPIVRHGFKITNPSGSWLVFTADIGMSTSWNSRTYVKVTVSAKYKGKICSTSLCGNNNGRPDDDNQYSTKCSLPPQSCFPDSKKKAAIDICHLMSNASSPFTKACNRYVVPAALISNCKYDAGRCTDPIKCVCNAFAAYSKLCVEYGGVIDWRFKGTYLYPKLKECEKTCSNKGEIFTECGSACAKTCRDISRGLKCSERCIPGCQCPKGSYLDDKNHCVPMKKCPCFFEGIYYKAGESVKVGRCKTCTCNRGAMTCVDDRKCSSKSPCESFPCKNDGGCREEGDTFTCFCINGYEGKTCEELPPSSCDSRPCKNNGICTSNGDAFSCECAVGFEGHTCEVLNACAREPCKNEGVCTTVGSSYNCKCKYGFAGKNCQKLIPTPCDTRPCKNNGVYTNNGDKFSCKCASGFKG